MRKILGLSLFLLLCFSVVPAGQVKSVGCGESCYSNADCDAPCTYCHIVGGAIKGTCQLPPTPTPTPTPTPPAPCGQSCFSNADCASPCPYCEIVGGALKGTCTTAPTPTPPPGGGVQPEVCKKDTPQEGIMTAIGCIPTKDTAQFVAWFLKFAIGIGGGIAFLLMLFGAFQILTSSGDPERLKAGKELIGSALAGLLMIIFSLFLLRLIGIEILQIPGLK